jgi:hypothetical protein
MVGGNGIKQLSDNSAEILSGPDSIVSVGDTLRGILQINTVENIFPPFPPGLRPIGTGGVNELTALFEVVVTGKACVGLNCTFTFGAYAPFAAEIALMPGWVGPTAGAAVAFFEDATPDFTRTGTVADGEDSASSNGGGAAFVGSTPYWLFAFDGGDDFWVANTTFGDDISLAPPFTSGGIFNVGLTLIQNYSGIELMPIACFNPLAGPASVSACANGQISGPTTGSFEAWDDVNFIINAVPEPGTLGLFGIALLGFGWMARRRNQAA